VSLSQKDLISDIPDLRDLSLDRLAELDDSVLAHSIALHCQRLLEAAVPISSFSSSI